MLFLKLINDLAARPGMRRRGVSATAAKVGRRPVGAAAVRRGRRALVEELPAGALVEGRLGLVRVAVVLAVQRVVRLDDAAHAVG